MSISELEDAWNMIKIDTIIKWTATLVLIVGSYINSAGVGSAFKLGPYILLVGGILWLIQAIRWRESALIVTNAFMVIAGGTPLIMDLLKTL